MPRPVLSSDELQTVRLVTTFGLEGEEWPRWESPWGASTPHPIASSRSTLGLIFIPDGLGTMVEPFGEPIPHVARCAARLREARWRASADEIPAGLDESRPTVCS